MKRGRLRPDREEMQKRLVSIVTDDRKRIQMQYNCVYILLAAVAAFMTVLNLITGKGALIWATFAFMLLCLINLFILHRFRKTGVQVSSVLFIAELIALFIFFIVSGNPEGFSAIWICMLPACGMLLFGIRTTAALCSLMLGIMVFFFQTPIGQGFLHYPYTQSFRTRFPILFVAFFLLSVVLELIRSATQNELMRMRKRYEYLYSHDALTSLLNRHGLYEWRDSLKVRGEQTVLMIDLDHFKKINDSYGHSVGDLVLASVSMEIARHVDTKICRWGGEEFVVWSPKGSLPDEEAEAIRAGVEALVVHIPNCEKTVGITVSIGVARGGPNDRLEDLIHLADTRLYRAKESGRNRVIYE